MDLGVVLQANVTGTATTEGANATTSEAGNLSAAFEPEKVGPIGEFLRDVGVPYAAALGAIITFIVGFLLLYALGRATVVPVANRLLDRRGVKRNARRPLVRIVKVFVVFLAVAIAFSWAGYGNLLSSLATIAAAATLAIGFALQNVIENFVSGVFIYTDRPFRIGDWIEWGGPSGGYAGTVEDISLRVTRVRTFDNELLTVPNSILTNGVIKNPVAKDELRLQFNFGIGYEDDIEQATGIIREEAERHPDILDDPAPTVRMTDSSHPDRGALADSYVGLTARFWIENPSRAAFLRIRGEYVTTVKERFDAVGIDMPDPQIDLSGQRGENPPVSIDTGER